MSAATAFPLNSSSLKESYRCCRRIAQKRAKNFYYSFLLLEKPQRDAMCAIYAFMRQCDDLSDDPTNADKVQLSRSISMWRLHLERALRGEFDADPIWPAFYDTVQRYKIPHRFFYEMIDGISSDLQPQQIQTYDELYHYCYQVASVVGLTIIHIFGFRSVRALLLAERCGVAFQLTNILRDVREDAEVGRYYLPAEDLQRFGVTYDQLRSGQENQQFRALMQFEAKRAHDYYQESLPLIQFIEPKSRRSLWALQQIYLALLNKIERADFNVLRQRLNLPTRVKVGLLLRAFVVKV